MTEYSSDYRAAPTEIDLDAAKIKRNKFLAHIYGDLYRRILSEIPPQKFPKTLEIGSGGGFLKDLAPHVITSECVSIPGVDRVVDAARIGEAFAPGELDAICGLNVFHHLPDVSAFLRGVARVLRPGGRLVLVEPWFTPVGQWFHRVLHHEPSVNDPDFWGIVGYGRMVGANTRLPTSVFRDSDARFQQEFPHLRICKREPFHKWLYLFSGGLRINTRVPGVLARRLVEWDRNQRAGNRFFGIFALIMVEARGD